MTQTIQRDLLTESRLEMLTRFHSDTYPVVSLYLDLRPEERQGGRLRTKLKSMIRQSEADLAAESEERREAFKAAADRLLDMLTQESNLSGRGLAVYSAPALDLWQRFSLPVAVKDRLVVSDRPYLRPLLTLADEYERYLIILIDKQEARLFITYLGAIAEYSEVKDELAPHPRAGGLSAQKYQRHHDMHVLWHAKHTVEVAEQVWARELCERLVIGGTPEAVAELRRHLPRALAERWAGEISVPVDAPADAVLTAVLHVEEAVERRVEAARVEELLTAALGHGPGVLGLKDTLTAVVEGGVLILVVEEDFAHPGFECPNCGYLSMTEAPRCPLCDHEVDAQADVVERASERALEEDGALEVLRGENRAALAGYGHIGALLRYRPAR